MTMLQRTGGVSVKYDNVAKNWYRVSVKYDNVFQRTGTVFQLNMTMLQRTGPEFVRYNNVANN